MRPSIRTRQTYRHVLAVISVFRHREQTLYGTVVYASFKPERLTFTKRLITSPTVTATMTTRRRRTAAINTDVTTSLNPTTVVTVKSALLHSWKVPGKCGPLRNNAQQVLPAYTQSVAISSTSLDLRADLHQMLPSRSALLADTFFHRLIRGGGCHRT